MITDPKKLAILNIASSVVSFSALTYYLQVNSFDVFGQLIQIQAIFAIILQTQRVAFTSFFFNEDSSDPSELFFSLILLALISNLILFGIFAQFVSLPTVSISLLLVGAVDALLSDFSIRVGVSNLIVNKSIVSKVLFWPSVLMVGFLLPLEVEGLIILNFCIMIFALSFSYINCRRHASSLRFPLSLNFKKTIYTIPKSFKNLPSALSVSIATYTSNILIVSVTTTFGATIGGIFSYSMRLIAICGDLNAPFRDKFMSQFHDILRKPFSIQLKTIIQFSSAPALMFTLLISGGYLVIEVLRLTEIADAFKMLFCAILLPYIYILGSYFSYMQYYYEITVYFLIMEVAKLLLIYYVVHWSSDIYIWLFALSIIEACLLILKILLIYQKQPLRK
jgi:hypothetical protein